MTIHSWTHVLQKKKTNKSCFKKFGKHHHILIQDMLLFSFFENSTFWFFSWNYNFEHTQWSLIWSMRGPMRWEAWRRNWESKVLENNLADLRELGQKLRAVQRTLFRTRYGNLLGLLEVQVQIPAITALVQYYDYPLRCFTFCDFQLVPTFEEYAQILDMPIDKVIHY